MPAPLPPARRRSTLRAIRLTAAEDTHIRQAAACLGVPVSQVIREAVLRDTSRPAIR